MLLVRQLRFAIKVLGWLWEYLSHIVWGNNREQVQVLGQEIVDTLSGYDFIKAFKEHAPHKPYIKAADLLCLMSPALLVNNNRWIAVRRWPLRSVIIGAGLLLQNWYKDGYEHYMSHFCLEHSWSYFRRSSGVLLTYRDTQILSDVPVDTSNSYQLIQIVPSQIKTSIENMEL